MKKQPCILVVDDHAMTRELVKKQFEGKQGFRVLTAEDGPSALELAVAHVPDLVLLDWIMPGMEGPTVLAELKRRDETAHIPVFMMTTKDELADVEQAIFAGAAGYFPKPFDVAKLGEQVQDYLAKDKTKRGGAYRFGSSEPSPAD